MPRSKERQLKEARTAAEQRKRDAVRDPEKRTAAAKQQADETWNKSGATRLAFSLILKFFEIEARFPRGDDEFPSAAVADVAGQVK